MRDRTESFNEQIAQFRVVGENNPILAFNAMPLSRYDVLEAPSRLKRAG
jgi:hypothetical protein